VKYCESDFIAYAGKKKEKKEKIAHSIHDPDKRHSLEGHQLPQEMPLTNRRRARRKEIQLQETSDAEAPDSSPSRPSAKKRKVSQHIL
jgi:hypothetical protein